MINMNEYWKGFFFVLTFFGRLYVDITEIRWRWGRRGDGVRADSVRPHWGGETWCSRHHPLFVYQTAAAIRTFSLVVESSPAGPAAALTTYIRQLDSDGMDVSSRRIPPASLSDIRM